MTKKTRDYVWTPRSIRRIWWRGSRVSAIGRCREQVGNHSADIRKQHPRQAETAYGDWFEVPLPFGFAHPEFSPLPGRDAHFKGFLGFREDFHEKRAVRLYAYVWLSRDLFNGSVGRGKSPCLRTVLKP